VSNNPVEWEGGGITDSFIAIQTTPDYGGIYPPNGTVTITEYTPHVLCETFSSTLVSRAEMHKAQSALPLTAGSITGSFTVAAALGDGDQIVWWHVNIRPVAQPCKPGLPVMHPTPTSANK